MRTSSRIAGVIAMAGSVAGEVGGALMHFLGGALMHFPPFLPQRFLQNPIGATMVVLLAITTATSLVLWAQTSQDFDRSAFAVAIVTVGSLAVVLNVVAPAEGWWGGLVFHGLLLPLAVLTGMRAMFQLALLLLLYRWLARRSARLALVVYLIILIGLVPGTVHGDRQFLASGVLTFARGYTVWHDVVLGEIFFILPLVVYEICRRRWCAGSPRAADALSK